MISADYLAADLRHGHADRRFGKALIEIDIEGVIDDRKNTGLQTDRLRLLAVGLATLLIRKTAMVPGAGLYNLF